MGNKQHKVEWTLKVGTEGGAEITALQRDLNTLGQIDSFSKLKKQSAEAEKAWKTATDKVAELARAMKTAEQPTKAMSIALDRARSQAGRLKDEFINPTARLKQENIAFLARACHTAQHNSNTGGRVCCQQFEARSVSILFPSLT